jgi:hypothetical protein
LGGRGQSTQGKKPGHGPPHLEIGGNQAFGVQFAERDVQCPLIWSYVPQAVQRQIDAFADTNSRGADDQESIRGQIIGSAQFLLQALILLRGKRSR